MKVQCAKCPWKVGTNPREILRGYTVEAHRALSKCIAEPADPNAQFILMACHDAHNEPCAGWLANQLGPGNNIPLRMHVIHGHVDGKHQLVGEQHATFEDTLPK